MKTFKIEIKEILSRIVLIEAETKDEAYLKVKEIYNSEEIVLDYSNHLDTEIKLIDEVSENFFEDDLDTNL
jgi:hypothetical protein